MGETHEVPQDHTLAGFRVYPGYTTERHAFASIPMLNALDYLNVARYHNRCIL